MKDFLEAGEFTTTHGIAGELRVYPWCDEPAFLTQFKTVYLDAEGKKPLSGINIRQHKNICLVQINGVSTVEQARQYIGKTIYISRKDANLPEGYFFVQDLLGALVKDAQTGEEYGKIKNITRPANHDVYEIERPNGSVALFPAVPSFLESTDIENGVVLINPIAGMFDDGVAKVPAEGEEKGNAPAPRTKKTKNKK